MPKYEVLNKIEYDGKIFYEGDTVFLPYKIVKDLGSFNFKIFIENKQSKKANKDKMIKNSYNKLYY